MRTERRYLGDGVSEEQHPRPEQRAAAACRLAQRHIASQPRGGAGPDMRGGANGRGRGRPRRWGRCLSRSSASCRRLAGCPPHPRGTWSWTPLATDRPLLTHEIAVAPCKAHVCPFTRRTRCSLVHPFRCGALAAPCPRGARRPSRRVGLAAHLPAPRPGPPSNSPGARRESDLAPPPEPTSPFTRACKWPKCEDRWSRKCFREARSLHPSC